MAFGIYSAAAFKNASGIAQIAASAAVEVRRESDGGLATIYSDRAGTTPISQPGFVSDSNGNFVFYAAGIADGYKVRVQKDSLDITLRYQRTGTAGELDATTIGATLLTATVADEARTAIDAVGLTEEDQSFAGGVIITSKSLGTISSGTVTPDPGDRPMQHYTNNGAHTLAPHTNVGYYLLDITNGASAGAITTSGWTKVEGATVLTTTNGHKFRLSCVIGNAGSQLIIKAMQ